MKTRVLSKRVDYNTATEIKVFCDAPPSSPFFRWGASMVFKDGEGISKIAFKLSLLAGQLAHRILFPPRALDAKSKLARKRVDQIAERMRGK